MHPYPQQEAYRAHALEEDLTGKDEVELAGPWQRIIAALINLALLFACIFVSLVLVLVFVSFFSFNHPIWTDITDSRLIAASLVAVFLPMLGIGIWQAVWMNRYGQSVGKRLLDIKVIRSDGGRAGFVRYVLLREAAYYTLLTLGDMLLAYLLFVRPQAPSLESYLAWGDSPEWLSWTACAVCLVMLFITRLNRRTLQDFLAGTLVIRLPRPAKTVRTRRRPT